MSSKSNKGIEPGGTIGVFGGGQLGRMFCHAAQRMGYQVVVFTDEAESPAAQVVRESIVGDYTDIEAVFLWWPLKPLRCMSRSDQVRMSWRSHKIG